MSIFIFSWNTQSVNYRSRPGFIDGLAQLIRDHDCDILVLGLQEDSTRHSRLLNGPDSWISTALSDYHLVDCVTMSGWGVTTYKAMKNDGEYRPRGLRLAIWTKKSVPVESVSVDYQVCPSWRDWITCGKGSVSLTIGINGKKLTFLNMHLPFSSRSIIKNERNNRGPAIMWQAKCLQTLYSETIRKFSPDHIFFFGDLNFRNQLRDEVGASEIVEKMVGLEQLQELYLEADELRLLSTYDNILPKFSEGVEGNGPQFYPTCKLAHHRKEREYKCGRYDQRTPSWCDRILYGSGIDCSVYSTIDLGEMNLSDHAAVYGVYGIND